MGNRAEEAMEDFLRACGATGPLELTVENRGLTAVRWSAQQPFALIGRDPAADLSLDHSRVDGQHVYLQMIEGELYWVDLGSQSGTRREIGTGRSGWLNYPHGIGIGPYLIQRASPGFDAAQSSLPGESRMDPLASRPQECDNLPRVVLEFRRHTAKPIRWRMRHILTLVGSSSHCKVRLAAPGVSPFHCSLLRTLEGVWVVNLLGQGGITLNGSYARAARIHDGDELMVGDVLIRVFFNAPQKPNKKFDIITNYELNNIYNNETQSSKDILINRDIYKYNSYERDVGRLFTERVPSAGEVSALSLARVLDQFGQMQQVFHEQFQQTTVMMFQALGVLHHDQMKDLSGKLDTLNQITEKLQEFQSRIEATVSPGYGISPHQEPNPAPLQPGQSGATCRDGTEIGQEKFPWTSFVREFDMPPENGVEDVREKIRRNVDQSNTPNFHVHEWLIDRITAIEDEQRTRWQKILDLVRGK
jgi:hypothetical protein